MLMVAAVHNLYQGILLQEIAEIVNDLEDLHQGQSDAIGGSTACSLAVSGHGQCA